MKEISFIIKTLNEEKNISKCIRSIIKNAKRYNYEIILVDSLSDDNTIKIAKKFPIKIIQITNLKDRKCGLLPQLGYQFVKGKYVFLIDGDMELIDGFLDEAIVQLKKNPKLAGVTGNLKEMNPNLLNRNNIHNKDTYLNKLNGFGIYKNEIIKKIGYLTNQNLHGYEEAELGIRIISNGYFLKGINKNGVKHYGHSENPYRILIKKWKRKYLHAHGELFKIFLSNPRKNFLILNIIKAQLLVILFWMSLIISIISGYLFEYTILIFLVLIMYIITKKPKNITLKIFGWHIITAGFILGIFSKHVNPKSKIKCNILK